MTRTGCLARDGRPRASGPAVRAARTVHAIVAALAIAGCAGGYQGSARSVSEGDLRRGDPGWMLATDLRLVRQTEDRDCGAAALAIMLARWSVPASKDEILRAIPRERGHGIAMGALRDYARGKGLRAYLIAGELRDLVDEMGHNHPVLVGLVQRYGDGARAHYEVVAGINPSARKVLLLDPGRGLREDNFDGFSAEWSAAGNPTLVIVES